MKHDWSDFGVLCSSLPGEFVLDQVACTILQLRSGMVCSGVLSVSSPSPCGHGALKRIRLGGFWITSHWHQIKAGEESSSSPGCK